MRNLISILLLIILVSGCAKQFPVVPVAWKTLPEFNVSYDKAWSTVLDVITEKNIKLDVVQKDAGYIKSTAMFWDGQSFTLSVKFNSKSPVIIKLQTMGTLFNNWTGMPIETGVPGLERVLLDEIEGRLRKIPSLTDSENPNKTDEIGQTQNSNEDAKTKLRKLQELYEEGLIEKEEYDRERKKVLDSI